MLLEDLSRLGSYSVWEADFELHDQVSSLAGGLGEGQPLPTKSLHCPWLDDVVAGERDHASIDGGNVHSAAAQGLRKEEETGHQMGLIPQSILTGTPCTPTGCSPGCTALILWMLPRSTG